MKTASIIFASLLFVTLRVSAAEVGENQKPVCAAHMQSSRSSIEPKVEDKKVEVKSVEAKSKSR